MIATALLLTLAMAAPHKSHQRPPKILDALVIDEMKPRIPAEILHLPYTPIHRPHPVITIEEDNPHTFRASAACPNGWVIDETDWMDADASTKAEIKDLLAHLTCRRRNHNDNIVGWEFSTRPDRTVYDNPPFTVELHEEYIR